jgi:NAD(P)-dependent dehydrogenase (short-subunit alcohol dehydrogenase family)
VLVKRDIAGQRHCRDIIQTAVDELGGRDIMVSNAASQMSHDTLEEISDDVWHRAFDTNICVMFHLGKAAIPHMRQGSPRSLADRR